MMKTIEVPLATAQALAEFLAALPLDYERGERRRALLAALQRCKPVEQPAAEPPADVPDTPPADLPGGP